MNLKDLSIHSLAWQLDRAGNNRAQPNADAAVDHLQANLHLYGHHVEYLKETLTAIRATRDIVRAIHRVTTDLIAAKKRMAECILLGTRHPAGHAASMIAHELNKATARSQELTDCFIEMAGQFDVMKRMGWASSRDEVMMHRAGVLFTAYSTWFTDFLAEQMPLFYAELLSALS